MIEFFATKLGNTILPIKDHAEKYDSIPEKVLLKIKITKTRSKEQHRLFFAAITHAYGNWPEDHNFQPASADHLRQWLICKPGSKYRNHITIDKRGSDIVRRIHAATVEAITDSTSDNKRYPFLTEDQSNFYVVYAKSISWDNMDQTDFNWLSSQVSELLLHHTGADIQAYYESVKTVA